jgi:mannosyltransferase
VVAGAALRFATLDLQSFWVDEGATVNLLRRDFGGAIDGIGVTEKTPPLYYLVAWLWTRPFGTGEIGVRSLSALAGTLTLPVVFAIGRELVSDRAGLAATALAAFNPLLVWYSQEARAYALLVLLTALSVLLFVRATDERAERRTLGWWALASALALATHYFALFVVGPLALWFVLRSRERRAAVAACAAVAAAGAALLPLAIEQSHNPGANFIRGTGLVTRMLQVPKQFLLGFDAPAETLLAVAAAVVAAAGVWLAFARTDPSERRGGLVAAGILGAGLALPPLVAVAGADFVLSRNLIAAAPLFYLVLGTGFGARRAGPLGPALCAALCAISLGAVIAVDAQPEYQRDDWRAIAEELGPATPGEVIVVNPVAGAVPLGIYLDGLRNLPPGESGVMRIDVVAAANRRPGETPRPPRPPTRLRSGFELVRRVEADSYTLVIMRAPAPAQLDDLELNGLRLDPALAATLLRDPEGRGPP